MTREWVTRLGALLQGMLILGGVSQPAHALSPAFTYQGQLQQGGSAITGDCDFEFGLWDGPGVGSPPMGGTRLGELQQVRATVNNGVFTVLLNEGGQFGKDAFVGTDRWLEIRVSCPAGTGNYSPLSPRQRVSAVPYAQFADNASVIAFSGFGDASKPVPDAGGALWTLAIPQAGTYVIVGKVLARAETTDPSFVACTLIAAASCDTPGVSSDSAQAHLAKVEGVPTAGSTTLPFNLVQTFTQPGAVTLCCRDFAATAAVQVRWFKVTAIKVGSVTNTALP